MRRHSLGSVGRCSSSGSASFVTRDGWLAYCGFSERKPRPLRTKSEFGLHRTTRAARVIGAERRSVDLLRPLLDTTLIWMSSSRMALTAFERDDTGGYLTDYG